jgi:hypothetical protein
MNREKPQGLTALIEDAFNEMESGIVTELRSKDETYAALRRRKLEIERQFPLVESTLEGEGPLSLSAEEHAYLAEYLSTTGDMESIERLNIYYAGHRDCVAFLKRIRAI